MYLNYSNPCDCPITEPLNYPNTDPMCYIIFIKNRSVFYFEIV